MSKKLRVVKEEELLSLYRNEMTDIYFLQTLLESGIDELEKEVEKGLLPAHVWLAESVRQKLTRMVSQLTEIELDDLEKKLEENRLGLQPDMPENP